MKRFRRRRLLREIRAHMAAAGCDPGDLTESRNYRRFLKGLRGISATGETGASTATVAAAMQAFGRAWPLFLPWSHARPNPKLREAIERAMSPGWMDSP